jgi:hypothetical protein
VFTICLVGQCSQFVDLISSDFVRFGSIWFCLNWFVWFSAVWFKFVWFDFGFVSSRLVYLVRLVWFYLVSHDSTHTLFVW